MPSGATATIQRVRRGPADPRTTIRVRGGLQPATSGLVRRTALIRRLTEADAALAVLVAPPGYGKSALLAQWTENDERPSAWLTLDERTGHDPAAPLRSTATPLAGPGVPQRGAPAGS